MAARSKSRSSGAASSPDAAVPETVEEALARARHHGRLAAAESVAALQALLEAAALGLSGRPAERDAILGPLARSMEDLRALIAPDDSGFGSSKTTVTSFSNALPSASVVFTTAVFSPCSSDSSSRVRSSAFKQSTAVRLSAACLVRAARTRKSF